MKTESEREKKKRRELEKERDFRYQDIVKSDIIHRTYWVVTIKACAVHDDFFGAQVQVMN